MTEALLLFFTEEQMGGRDLRVDLMREGFNLAAVKSLVALMQIMQSTQKYTQPQCTRGQSQHTVHWLNSNRQTTCTSYTSFLHLAFDLIPKVESM